jgi:hypothetical protein
MLRHHALTDLLMLSATVLFRFQVMWNQESEETPFTLFVSRFRKGIHLRLLFISVIVCADVVMIIYSPSSCGVRQRV